ncbi:MAG: S24/S26 family peptidase [Rhodospirillales bacterium]|nr:S24/S26 family peptidase [Rhodospirillales bacterium]
MRQIKATEYVEMRRFFGMPSDGRKAVQNAQNAYVVGPLRHETGLADGDAGTNSQWVIPAQIISGRTKATPENIKSFEVGDNLMAPEFQRGEHVLVDLSDLSPSPPGAFVVSDGFGTMIRNCERMAGSDPVRVRISALKDSFSTREALEKDAQIIGRVIAKLQWL